MAQSSVVTVGKVEIRKPQLKILDCLAKSKRPMSRKEIQEKTKLDPSWMGTWIGLNDLDKRAKSDKDWKLTCLLNLKAVKLASAVDEPPVTYEITSTGKALLEKASKTHSNGK